MKKYKLKNIVLSGGGHVGFTQIGLLYYLIEKKKLDIKNVENIYCTSIGSMVAIMFILNYDKDELFNYLINKPWEKFLKININNFLDYNTNKGLIGGYVFEEVLTSLLLAKDIKKDVTLKEFYNLNKINLNIFTIEINEFVTVRLSHKTHPNLKLLDAVHMTAAVPFVIHPHYYNNGVYIDGGLHVNYPLNPCIIEDQCKKEETLGIRAWKKQKDVFNLNKDSNVQEYANRYIQSYISSRRDNAEKEIVEMQNEIKIESGQLNMKDAVGAIFDKEYRANTIRGGEIHGKEFLKKCKKFIKIK